MEEQTSNAGQGLGIASLVLGIVALILAFIPCFGWIALIPGIIAIILAVVALSQASQARAPKGIIIAALVISILGTSVAAVWGVIIGTVASQSDHWGREWFRSLDRASDEFEKEFESGYGKSLDEAVKEIDTEMDKTLEELEKDMDSSIRDMEGLSDEEKAARIGRAAGKALKEFRKELEDTIPVD